MRFYEKQCLALWEERRKNMILTNTAGFKKDEISEQ
jgi:hypothetical protein